MDLTLDKAVKLALAFEANNKNIKTILVSNSDKQVTGGTAGEVQGYEYMGFQKEIRISVQGIHGIDVHESRNTIIQTYKPLFNEEGLQPLKVPPVHIILKDNAEPRFQKARSVAIPLQNKVNETLGTLVKEGVLETTNFPGLSAAPGLFQNFTEQLLSGIPGVAVFLDMVISGSTKQEHDKRRLKEVFHRMSEVGMTLNKDKCRIAAPQVKLLGCTVNEHGIQPDLEKVNAIYEAPAPRDKTELKAFLGLLNFYESFLKGKAHIAEPLHRLHKKDVDWKFGAAEKVFDVCKEFAFGLGAVSAVKEKDGCELPIAFASVTSITQLWTSKPMSEILSPRMLRLRLFLSSYTFTFKYRPGTQLGNADALSRLPLTDTMADPPNPADIFLLESEDAPYEAADIAKATDMDDQLRIVKTWIENGKIELYDCTINPELGKFKSRCNELRLRTVLENKQPGQQICKPTRVEKFREFLLAELVWEQKHSNDVWKPAVILNQEGKIYNKIWLANYCITMQHVDQLRGRCRDKQNPPEGGQKNPKRFKMEGKVPSWIQMMMKGGHLMGFLIHWRIKHLLSSLKPPDTPNIHSNKEQQERSSSQNAVVAQLTVEWCLGRSHPVHQTGAEDSKVPELRRSQRARTDGNHKVQGVMMAAIVMYGSYCIGYAQIDAQCYDGASAMNRKFKGLQKFVADLQPKAIYVHCAAHSLNFAVQDCLRHLLCIRDIMNFAKDLTNTKMKNLSSPSTLLYSVDNESLQYPTTSKCAGYFEPMQHFRTFFFSNLYCHVMSPVEEVNVKIQCPHIGVTEVQSKLSYLIYILEEKRGGYEQFWQKCLEEKPTHVQEPQLPQRQRIPNRLVRTLVLQNLIYSSLQKTISDKSMPVYVIYALRHLKTYLWSTMGQKRLNNLTLLNAYQAVLDNLDLKPLVNEFIKSNTVRRTTFALF
ncbi:hypothetical protein PR048_005530 [Dryococelus australis]|uniref:Reverse transcriptase domain-containing protein n=1 Tax=Dryococelus australis TaxID=614101 RepID=A0ABQ9I8H1_9NEOP|nr:hypothetical protein PR048_005530 [Dryococelus australis]